LTNDPTIIKGSFYLKHKKTAQPDVKNQHLVVQFTIFIDTP